jgi:hypothetical protein
VNARHGFKSHPLHAVHVIINTFYKKGSQTIHSENAIGLCNQYPK